ncbi:DUF4384 domain-containing protein [Treponema sp. OttesenSCG-928-L16]|nr:DUF4384 domain-containing protein [Treponema sp. OttesenSCG-928-L16]
MNKRYVLSVLIVFMLPLYLFSLDLDAEISQAVSVLSDRTRPISIGIGSISFGDTKSVSDFSSFLKNQIRFSAARNSNKFRVVNDDEVDAFINNTNFARTRSIDPLGRPAGSSGSTIQGFVEGTFYQVGDNVEVMLWLTNTSNNSQIGASKFTIPAEELRKRGLSILPPKGETVIEKVEFEEKKDILEPFAGKDNDFNIQVWTNRADNIFYDGDEMAINLYAEESCYFKVYHLDVYGNRQLIYPNRYDTDNFLRAGVRRTIPDGSRFSMTKPYGEEYILVFASNKPFEDIPGEENSVKITRAGVSRGLNVVYKNVDHVVNTNPKTATAQYNYTILPASGK